MASETVLKSERASFLDFARGFAILSIVVFHALFPIATGVWSTAILFGGAGVHAFLFLSGFGLACSASQRSLRGFYRRRFGRVLVPYFVFVTGLFLVNLRWPIYPDDGLRAYLGHVLLFKMFDESIICSFGYHLWFLSTIIQLYLVFPWLYRALQRFGDTRFFAMAFVVSSLSAAFVILTGRADLRVFNSCGPIYLWEFALGMIAGHRFATHDERFWEAPTQWVLPVTCGAVAFQASLSIWGGPVGEILNNAAALVGYLGVVMLAYRVFQSLEWHSLANWLNWVGDISYPLYLVHGVIIARMFGLLEPNSLVWKLLLSFGTVAVSLFGAVVFDALLRLPNAFRALQFAASSRA